MERMQAGALGQQFRRYMTPLIFIGADYLTIGLTSYLAITLYDLSVSNAYVYVWLPLTFVLFLAQSKAYSTMQPFIYTVKNIFYAISFGVLACIVAIYFFTTWQAARSFFVVFWLLMLLLLLTERFLINFYCKKRHHLYEDVIFVGAGKTAERALHYFQDDLGYRYHVIGFLDDDPISDKIPNKYKLLGKINEAEKIVENSHVQNVIITTPGMERDKLQQLITTVQPHVRNLSYVPDLIGTPMMGVEAQVLFTEEILMLHLRNNLAMRRNKIYKRTFDLVCTICGGMLILPIIAIVALLVAIDNKGNVIFAHRRIGKDGKEFPCYKFQSMVPN
ncbi:MAG: sugar transferase, partial [Selenomonas sp.]|uniref:sugar transferase n=1 Tax=Selenomonas sp. TaxID=2053611 RepID=UPI0025D46F5D